MNETCILCGKQGVILDNLHWEDDGCGNAGWMCSDACQLMPHATVKTFAKCLSTKFRCATCGEHHYWRH